MGEGEGENFCFFHSMDSKIFLTLQTFIVYFFKFLDLVIGDGLIRVLGTTSVRTALMTRRGRESD